MQLIEISILAFENCKKRVLHHILTFQQSVFVPLQSPILCNIYSFKFEECALFYYI